MKLPTFYLLTLLTPLVLSDPSPHSNKPISQLLSTAATLLSSGDLNGALDHFDAAIKRDPSNYLTLFKRGATYLSLGKSSQATADFDAVLAIKPGFEAALVQRAKLKAMVGEWGAAKRDYVLAGGKGAEVEEVEEAEAAMKAAEKAEKKAEWETCVAMSGRAIRTAKQVGELRARRARCRLARGDVYEAYVATAPARLYLG